LFLNGCYIDYRRNSWLKLVFIYYWLPLRLFGPIRTTYIKSNFLTLSTKVVELHLLQWVTPKRSSTITILTRVVIFYGQWSARDQLVIDTYNFVHTSIMCSSRQKLQIRRGSRYLIWKQKFEGQKKLKYKLIINVFIIMY